jgi:uncharacterized membrane protein
MISPQLAPLVFGIAAAVAWGTADFFAAKASKANSAVAAALWISTLSWLAYVGLFIANPGNWQWTSSGILYAATAGIFLELGIYVFYRGLEAGPVSIVAPISSAYPLVTAFVGLLIFNGLLRTIDLLGIVIVVTGIAIASGLLGAKSSERKLNPGVLYALATIFLWGVAYALIGQSVAAIGWQKSVLIDTSSGLIALYAVLALTERKALRASLNTKYIKDKFITSTAAIQLSGGIVFTIGLAHSKSPAVITAIAACYPSITALLAFKHLGEKKHKINLIGSFLTIAGVIILVI